MIEFNIFYKHTLLEEAVIYQDFFHKLFGYMHSVFSFRYRKSVPVRILYGGFTVDNVALFKLLYFRLSVLDA
jgi:hypothetical protein